MPSAGPSRRWYDSLAARAVAGSLLLWAAFPPLGVWPLALVAPLPWLLVARQPRLDAPRPYRALYLAGLLFWLLAIHWLRLPHWATHFGWLALSAYLALYIPLFVGLTRVAVHRLGVSLVLAAPVVWTGLELARGRLLGGFLMASLGHTQQRWTALIQISDLGGAYAVSFLVMLIAACLARICPTRDARPALWPLLPLALALGLALAYGQMRLAEAPARPGPRVALIQGSIDADWKADPGKEQRILKEYYGLSRQAVRAAAGRLDLIVWPETMYRGGLYVVEADYVDPPGTRIGARDWAATSRQSIADLVAQFGVPTLLGTDTVRYAPGGARRYNSALLADAEGRILGSYDKMHLVTFGEYVPLAEYFPWLYRLTPLGGGLDAGTRAEVLESAGVRFAPNICFESVVPHVVGRQFRELERRGTPPDVLVDLTNDAWFWGSSELDMHLACGQFRAVELRRPLLIAANGGFSALVDGSGRLAARSGRRTRQFLLVDVPLDGRASLYARWGDLPAGLCLTACLLLAAVGLRDRRSERPLPPA